MDINMTASTALAQNTNDSLGISVLKKSLNIEAQNAQILLDAIPQPAKSASNLPPHLGQNINTSA